MESIKKLIQAGNKAQLEKLHEHGHKNGFDNIDIDYAQSRIWDEWSELVVESSLKNRDHKKIRHEAADIANFAHMIILQCDKIIEEGNQ